MPAPDHLRLILHALGTGGTREMAERVHEYTAGLQRQIDGLTAQIAQSAVSPPDVAALRGEVKAALAEARRMTRLREETLIGVEQALAGAGVTLTADDDPVAVLGRTLREQAAEIRRLNTLLEPKRAGIRDLIEASSLGTPDAVAARESVPVELAQAAVARAAELAGDDGPTVESARPPSNDEIRAWCQAHGVQCSPRGPISNQARRAYDNAHQEA